MYRHTRTNAVLISLTPLRPLVGARFQVVGARCYAAVALNLIKKYAPFHPGCVITNP